jgi:ribosomal protein S18 acetylase RimI-like enzyme
MEECLRRARATDAPFLQLHTMDAMRVARTMYERMGFVRAPQLDFEPIGELEVYGYTLDLRPDVADS